MGRIGECGVVYHRLSGRGKGGSCIEAYDYMRVRGGKRRTVNCFSGIVELILNRIWG